MKKIFLLLFLFMLPAIASAQPSISFDSDNYDFGTVEQGKSLEHIFEVSNGGDAELIIQKLVPS